MSRFFSEKYSQLEAYVPGEQPRDMQYVKLNTNESPYPPSPLVLERVKEECGRLNLYSDPECTGLRAKAAALAGVEPENVLLTNGSDEVLNFAFMAFGDGAHPFVFPNITYGFYPVVCQLNNIPYEEIPLKEDFSICVEDYIGVGKHIIIANPNAPTGIALPVSEIERIVASNPDNIVLIDEAYVDFGGESCIPLTAKYGNLLVIQTFSKSRSLAGARLGFAVGGRELIADLNTLKYSTNPYNINRMSMVAGEAAVDDNGYYMANCRRIAETRAYTVERLTALGFTVLPSKANFVFAKSPDISGLELYQELKRRGVLIRHFTRPEISQYNRITIGTKEQMDRLLAETEKILQEKVGK